MNCLLGIALWLAFAGMADEVGTVETSLEAPHGCPTGLAFDGTLLWVADRKKDQIYGINPENGEIVKTLETPGYWPTGLAFDGEQLWVADQDQKIAFRLDPATGLTTRTIELDIERPEGLAFDGKNLWCVDGKEDVIASLDPEDGTNIHSFPAPSGNPTGLAYDGKYLWVADRIEDAMYRVDPVKGTALVKISSPGKYPYGLAPVPEGVWCADYQQDTLDRISLKGSKLIQTSQERMARLAFVMDLINFGPGMVERADLYVAVPSDGDNQQLLGEILFEPEPLEYLEDRWGQKIAHFRFDKIESSNRVQAVMKCDVVLREVSYLLFPEKVGTLDEIPADLSARYLADGTKYDLTHDYIAQTAQEIVGEEQNVLEAVLKIYDFVIEKLRYELVGGWNTAATVLERGTGSCSEYTFSFIALCRAAGIPARYAGSVVIRGDDASFDNVFHRWAEVFLPNYGWVPFDPSRGDKKAPAHRLQGMGWLSNTLFITTRGGGDSEYLGWTYNAEMRWTSQGKCKVHTEQIAEWEPLETN